MYWRIRCRCRVSETFTPLILDWRLSVLVHRRARAQQDETPGVAKFTVRLKPLLRVSGTRPLLVMAWAGMDEQVPRHAGTASPASKMKLEKFAVQHFVGTFVAARVVAKSELMTAARGIFGDQTSIAEPPRALSVSFSPRVRRVCTRQAECVGQLLCRLKLPRYFSQVSSHYSICVD